MSVQAQITNLLRGLQDDLGLSYVFISHDLSVIRHVRAHVAVIYLGKVVEYGTAEQVYQAPRHPDTRALLAAAPGGAHSGPAPLEGDLPSRSTLGLAAASAPPPGSPGHLRRARAVA